MRPPCGLVRVSAEALQGWGDRSSFLPGSGSLDRLVRRATDDLTAKPNFALEHDPLGGAEMDFAALVESMKGLMGSHLRCSKPVTVPSEILEYYMRQMEKEEEVRAAASWGNEMPLPSPGLLSSTSTTSTSLWR